MLGHGPTADTAFGLQFGVLVFGLLDAPALDSLRSCVYPEIALEQVAKVVLGLLLAD